MAGRAVPAPVRVLAVSDEVDDAIAADPGPVRGADLIVACGDLPFEYLGSLMNALDIPLVFVPGNHDPDLSGYRSSRAGLTLRAGMPVGEPWPAGAVNADGHVVDAAGLRLAGLGGCLRYRDGPNQYTDRQQARRALALRAAARWRRQRDGRGVDLLLTHAPPPGGPVARPRASRACLRRAGRVRPDRAHRGVQRHRVAPARDRAGHRRGEDVARRARAGSARCPLTPGSPEPTWRTTSFAPGAARCCPGSPSGCAAGRTTSMSSCRSTRSSPHLGCAASGGSAYRPSG